jgi:hypothetical protein
MATTTNYGWTTPDDTSLVKDGAAAIRTLGSSVDTTTKALNPSTTLGDIEYRSSTANTNTRLGIGSTGQILTVAGGVPTWAAPAAGGGMTLLSTTTLSGASTTISSISGSYKHLLVMIKDAYTTGADTITLQFNGTTSSNYGNRMFRVTGTTLDAATANNTYIRLSEASSNTDWSNVNNGEFWVWRYTDTSNIEVSSSFAGYDGSAKTGTINEGRFNASAAVTSITIGLTGNSFSAGTVYIYGVN